MLPDPVSNPGPLTYESGALPIALRGPEIRRLIKDNRPYFSIKNNNIFCDPSLESSCQDGSNEGSQDMFLLRNKKNYL